MSVQNGNWNWTKVKCNWKWRGPHDPLWRWWLRRRDWLTSHEVSFTQSQSGWIATLEINGFEVIQVQSSLARGWPLQGKGLRRALFLDVHRKNTARPLPRAPRRSFPRTDSVELWHLDNSCSLLYQAHRQVFALTLWPVAASKMNSMPLDVHMKILPYLSLNEIAKCRLVTRSYKQVVEETLKYVTHVSVTKKREENAVQNNRKEVLDLFYIRITFFSKPFVEAHLKDLSWTDSLFLVFLAKFCPNLRVLRIKGHSLFSDQLLLLQPSLQFFTCDDLSFENRDSLEYAQSLCAHLPNLQGFITYLSLFPIYANKKAQFSKELFKLNGTLCRICDHEVDGEFLQLLTRGGTKFLHMCLRYRVLPPFCISQPLAESLVELSLDFLPTGRFCSFSLPNLVLLEVKRPLELPAIAQIGRFPSMPNLRNFIFKAMIASEDFCKLMNIIYSFDNLQYLMLNFPGMNANISIISLPQNLNTLIVETVQHFRFSDHFSTSLKKLFVPNIGNLWFNFPNLEVLNCELGTMNSQLNPQLLESLSKCGKLRIVEFRLRAIYLPVCLQPLIDLLLGMNHLEDLALFGPNLRANENLRYKMSLGGHSSTSLKRLYIPNMIELRFNFPNLEVLNCEHQTLSPKLNSQLMQSLSKCGKLRKVEFQLRRIKKSVGFQPLVDLLSSMDHLQHLSLFCSSKTPTTHLKLHEGQSLANLHLELAKTEVVLHLFGSLRSLKLDRPNWLSLKGPGTEFNVKGKPITIMFNQ